MQILPCFQNTGCKKGSTFFLKIMIVTNFAAVIKADYVMDVGRTHSFL